MYLQEREREVHVYFKIEIRVPILYLGIGDHVLQMCAAWRRIPIQRPRTYQITDSRSYSRDGNFVLSQVGKAMAFTREVWGTIPASYVF